ncbi:MAG: hypothetical protein H7Z72_06470 [Bacteroidetes bacterium]|nr:hypothetical protein [Fibrella sp.]
MKNFSIFLLLLAATSCSVDPFGVKPKDLFKSEGSDLLEFRATYVINGYDGTSRVIRRTITHQFDKDCRLSDRREVYNENNYSYYTERFAYAYNNRGLLITQKQYETYYERPEQLVAQTSYVYDAQDRLISENYQNKYIWKFEYIDDKKQINRYYCTYPGENCTLSTITVNGKRTYPESSPRVGGEVSSSPTPYGNMAYETVDAKGNDVLAEVYEGREKKTLLEKVVQTYDTHPPIPLAVDEADFKGHPAEDYFRSGNNLVQSDHYKYDRVTGAVREHLRSVSQYTYNSSGYPNQVKTLEMNVLTGKLTGVRTFITVRYGCSN